MLFLTGITDFGRYRTDRRIGLDLDRLAQKLRTDPREHRVVKREDPRGNLAENRNHSGRKGRGGGLEGDGVRTREPGKEHRPLGMGLLGDDRESRKSENFLCPYDGIERAETGVISEYPLGRHALFHERELHALDFVVARGGVVSGYEKAVDPLFLVQFGGCRHAESEIGVRPSVGKLRGRPQDQSYRILRHRGSGGIGASVRGDFDAQVRKRAKRKKNGRGPKKRSAFQSSGEKAEKAG